MEINKSEKVIGLATVAIALGAVIQGVVAFKDFSSTVSEGAWLELGALLVIGIFVLLAAGLAFKAYELSREI